MAREVISGLSTRADRTGRKSSIGSVKDFLRSVNCNSLVGLRQFPWQQSVDTVCWSKEITRIAKLVYLSVVGYCRIFLARLFRARTSPPSSAVRRRRTKTSHAGQGNKMALSWLEVSSVLRLMNIFRSLQSMIKVNIWRISMWYTENI